MTQENAERKAAVLQKMVKHPDISYHAKKLGESRWGIVQFFGEKEVAIVA